MWKEKLQRWFCVLQALVLSVHIVYAKSFDCYSLSLQNSRNHIRAIIF